MPPNSHVNTRNINFPLILFFLRPIITTAQSISNKGNRNELRYTDVDRVDAFVVLNASSIVLRRTADDKQNRMETPFNLIQSDVTLFRLSQ